MKKDNQRVLFVASSGGHLTQLLQLEKMFKHGNYLILTEKNNITKSLKKKYDLNFLMYCSRKKFFSFIPKFIINCFISLWYIVKFNPRYIITTGAGAALPICYIGKIFGKKIVYIESFARIDSKSLSGKLIYPISNLFIVQWKQMQKLYPKAKCFGSIY